MNNTLASQGMPTALEIKNIKPERTSLD